MIYIILAAGKGSRLHPLTMKYPKSLYKLDGNTTVLQRMVSLIKKNDSLAKIVVVNGFMYESIENELNGVEFVYNPFYSVTNSISSLWFAREYLGIDNTVILNADIVASDELVKDIICKSTDKPLVLLDSSIKKDGDYNVQTSGAKVVVMSKKLDEYFGEYGGVVKLDRGSSVLLRDSIEEMIKDGFIDQWYEDALVQMIFRNDFNLYYEDIADYDWTEVDCVGDLMLAKEIVSREK
ncbi:MAG: NTP transferase domain-containing protein [Clostridium sp.]